MGEVIRLPVIRYSADDAEVAYEAHRALLLAEREHPALADLPSFSAAKREAYERFARCFARL